MVSFELVTRVVRGNSLFRNIGILTNCNPEYLSFYRAKGPFTPSMITIMIKISFLKNHSKYKKKSRVPTTTITHRETISWNNFQIFFQLMNNKNIDSQSESIPLDRAPAFKVADDKTAVNA
jgi:hypothetical protein